MRRREARGRFEGARRGAALYYAERMKIARRAMAVAALVSRFQVGIFSSRPKIPLTSPRLRVFRRIRRHAGGDISSAAGAAG